MELVVKNGIVLVDKKDFKWLSQYNWQMNKKGYTKGWVEGRYWLIHRFILGLFESTPLVDHRDCNPRNCQRSNLRTTDRKGNSTNRRKTKGLLPKGVRYYQSNGIINYNRFVAQIQSDYKKISIGVYNTATEAAKAYRVASLQLHGKFARTG